MKEQTRKIFEEYLQSHLESKEVDPGPFLKKVPLEDRLAFKRKLVALKSLDQTFKVFSGAQDTRPSSLLFATEESLENRSYAGCRLEKKLGQGGMGVVYLAFQEKLKREVVLKILRPFAVDNPTLVARFLRESEIIAGLDHPNIVPIYDLGKEAGSLFLIMKFIPGKSLAQLIDERRGAPDHASLKIYLNILEKIAGAVQFAHGRGVAHRDIKPSNIMIQPDGTPVLLDFGLAWVEKEQEMTLEGEFLGTPVYSAPESFDKQKSQNYFLWDVYSLGITGYELITGKLPYEGETLYEVYNHLKTKEPRSPKVHWKDIPGDLDTILMKAIAKDPRLRYPSVEQFRSDLEHFSRGQPIQARPPSWWQRVIYFLKRNYRWEIPTALALLALLGISMATRTSFKLSEVEAEKIVLEDIVLFLEAKREKAAQLFDQGREVLEQNEKNLSDLTHPPPGRSPELKKEIQGLEASLRQNPQDHSIMESLATEYLAESDLPKAEAMARNILQQNPATYMGHLILADVYLVRGWNLERAQGLVKDFNRYYPEENMLNGLLGTRCLLLRNYECAREFFGLATLQNPRKYGEFLIATQMALGNFEAAEKLYERANEFFPDNPEFLEGLALVLAKLERFPEAEGVAKKALILTPDKNRVEKLLRSIEAQIYFDQQNKSRSAS